jgi:hypothetical protein
VRWDKGQRLAQRRIAREAQRKLSLSEALGRVDELRRFAQDLKAQVGLRQAARENLAFHLAWRRVRRAYGLG